MAAESVRNGARSGEPAESQNEDFTSRGSTSNGAHEKKYTHAAVEGTANGDVDHSKGIPVAINTHASAVGDSQADAQKNIDSATTNQKDNDTQVNTSTDTHSDGPVDTTTESPSGAHADVQAELDTNNSESPEITIGNESDKRVCELHSNADDQEQPEVLIIRSISDLDTGTHETVKLTDTSQDEGTEDIGSHAGHAEADANIGNHRNDFSAGKVVIVRKRSNLHAGSHHTHTGGHHHHKSSRHTNTNHTQPNAKGKDKAEGDAGQTATGAEAKEDNSKELAGGNNEGVPISRTLHNSADREPELQRVESQQSHGGEIGNLLKVQTSTGQLSGPSSDVSMQRSFSLRKVMHDSHKEKLGHRKTDNNTGKVTYKKTNSQELMDCIQLGMWY
ncbi:hypothetical protein SARC_02785 [Sphaeroforma arctica JP610]|uniref:Uncharacterized protein n=1 Tax=Sphaeroforma arctica JP610 TaxID=667725 RepID=A0A0L0G815_9EUKA|nr:hypothetical protein SARC_02785 [Sphaeroforma arctica JP610]KNC85031.1 hypothetical protein SARC_02785 [Sphaeroforma arctica JP610]|eukprot:XP_014158933.1 hypothetical protein SARC_02785 [Sphaeroforma arctica JP610]